MSVCVGARAPAPLAFVCRVERVERHHADSFTPREDSKNVAHWVKMSNDRLATIKGTKARNLLNLSMALSLGLGLVFLLLTGTRALAQEEHTQDRSSPHSREGILQRAPAAVTLTRGPYPQSVTTASVIVVWETAGPAGSQVDYGPTAGYGFAVSDPSSGSGSREAEAVSTSRTSS